MIESALGPAAKKALEALMPSETYQFKGETAVKNQAIGRAESVLSVLEARGLEVSDALRERLFQITDRDVLDGLVRRAVAVDTPEELFED